MNFASPYVFNNAVESENYEAVSDDEFKEGMDLSDSGSEDEAREEPRDVTDSARGGSAPPSEPAPSPLRRVMGALRNSLSRSVSVPQSSGAGSPPRQEAHQRSKSGRLHHWKSVGHAPDAQESRKRGKRVFRRADTNVVSIGFATLKTPSAMHAGEAISCSDCAAIMSHISCINDEGEDKVWKCEFCNHRNVVDIEPEEKPTADDVTYLLEPALSTTASGTLGKDESVVIFCVDTSGSMTITTEVPGHQNLRGSSVLRRLRRENTMEGDQRLPSESRNITYISRLQAVQAAVDHQLGEMARDFPDRRVGLVTFSCEVDVIGDGMGEVVTVSGRRLTQQDELAKVGSELPCPKPIKETRTSLGEKVFVLEEGGSTALGPALMVSLSMASQRPGSKVIVCTDGKSNEGVGKVENLQDSDPDPGLFYEDVAAQATAKGVSISVITIKGTDCKLIQLGKLADSTGGQVNIVDPLKLMEEFSNVLADRIIATNVVATFILHRGLYIGKEENEASKERREIGNVRSNHEISFEYGVRKKKTKPTNKTSKPSSLDCIAEVSTCVEENSASEDKEKPSSEEQGEANSATTPETGAAAEDSLAGAAGGSGDHEGGEAIPSELPFQLQIVYTDVDGAKALRVLTQKKPVTNDRNVAEREANLDVLGVHTERRASELALQGDYTQSRAVALMNQRLGWRSSRTTAGEEGSRRRKSYHRAFSRVKSVENRVQAKQMQEVNLYGRTHSDDEEMEEEEVPMEMSAVMAAPSAGFPPQQVAPLSKKRNKKKLRSEEVDDEMAQMMYESCSSSTANVTRQSTTKK